MTTSYYHITTTEWDGGDLQCWYTREALGLVTDADWKWTDAPVGTDGQLVSLAATIDELDDVRYGADDDLGTVLRITIPDQALTDSAELDWDDEDEDRVHLVTIREGLSTYTAALARIPAKFIEVVK